MITVPEAARKTGRDPETIRRWIRSGRLRSKKIGTQHMIEETDLDQTSSEDGSLPLPRRWTRTWTGEPQPDWVRMIRRSRLGH
jgi:excisionase family DNA binding protein